MSDPTIYFIRHGETEWNRLGRLQGQMDIPINPAGRGQAKRNGGVLAEVLDAADGIDFVASPLTRTRQTMEILRAVIGLDERGYRTDDRLVEIRFGVWEGLSWVDLKRDQRAAVRARRADPFNYVVPGGESYAMVTKRVLDWLGDVERDTVVVAHGGIMRCLRGHVLAVDQRDIPKLDVPQDRVMVIAGGKISWL